MSKPAKLWLAVCLLLVATLIAPVQSATAESIIPVLSSYWGASITQWESLIGYYAGMRGLDPDLIAAMIYEESHGISNQISTAGAVGLMQIMPREAGFSWRPVKAELLKPPVNLYWGTRTIAQVLQQAEGRIDRALAAYNGGWEQETLRAPTIYKGKVLDHYARALAARAGYDARSLKAWTLVLNVHTSAGLSQVTLIRSDGAIEADADFDLAKMSGSAPYALTYSAIDASGTAWLVETWVIIEPIEGGTPGGRGTY